MPDPIAAGDIVQVVIESRVEGQTMLNVLYFKANEAEVGSTYFESLEKLIESVVSDLNTAIVARMTPLMGPNAQVTNVQAQRVYPTRDVYRRQPLGEPGTHVDDCDATNVAAVIVKQSSVAGRGRSGTFHLGGLGSTSYALGEMTNDAVGLLTALGDSLDDKQPGVGDTEQWIPGMFNASLGAPNNFTTIAATAPRKTLRVMRRRTVGVGI